MPKLKQPTREPAKVQRPAVQRISLSVPEAAEATGLSRSTLYNLMKAEELAFVKCGARRLIPVPALNELLDRLAQYPGVER